MMFFTDNAVKVLWPQHRVGLGVSYGSYAFQSGVGVYTASLVDSTTMATTAIPVLLDRLGVLLDLQKERWNWALFNYGSPVMTLALQLRVAGCQFGQRLRSPENEIFRLEAKFCTNIARNRTRLARDLSVISHHCSPPKR